MEVKFVELKQRHVEAFFTAEKDMDREVSRVYVGNIVRLAVKLGFFETPKIESVDEMAPRDVTHLAEKIKEELARVLEVPPS